MEFVTPLTFQTLSGHPVASETLNLTQESEIGHINLADSADLFVIAPATAASRLLLPGGVLSISYYEGLFDEHHEEALPKAFPDLKYQYRAVPYAELVFCLDSIPELKTTQVDYRFEVDREFLFDFLSIPAQSAGLFPKLSYLERIPKVRELCDGLAGKVSPLFMGWKFLISRKPPS